LERSLARSRSVGSRCDPGWAGAIPKWAANAALEEAEHLKQVLQGADMVFIAAAWAAHRYRAPRWWPNSAGNWRPDRGRGQQALRIRRQDETPPGRQRHRELRKVVDTIITIPNDRLFSLSSKNSRIKDVFGMANEVLGFCGTGDFRPHYVPGFINVILPTCARHEGTRHGPDGHRHRQRGNRAATPPTKPSPAPPGRHLHPRARASSLTSLRPRHLHGKN